MMQTYVGTNATIETLKCKYFHYQTFLADALNTTEYYTKHNNIWIIVLPILLFSYSQSSILSLSSVKSFVSTPEVMSISNILVRLEIQLGDTSCLSHGLFYV